MEAILTVDRQSFPRALVPYINRHGAERVRSDCHLTGPSTFGPAKVCMQGRDRRLRIH